MPLIIKIMGRLQEVVMTVGWHLCNFMWAADWDETEDEDEDEECRELSSNPPHGWLVGNANDKSINFSHTYDTTAKGCKRSKMSERRWRRPGRTERRRWGAIKMQPGHSQPKGVSAWWGRGKSDPKWKSKDWGHAKCCQLHCTIFAHIESGNFDNLRNLKNVLMNCNILNNEFCEPCAISPPFFIFILCFF